MLFSKISVANNNNIEKIIHNNSKIELMQWWAERVRGISFDNKGNIPWPRKSNLEAKFKRFEV